MGDIRRARGGALKNKAPPGMLTHKARIIPNALARQIDWGIVARSHSICALLESVRPDIVQSCYACRTIPRFVFLWDDELSVEGRFPFAPKGSIVRHTD
ncbi:MAG: hypothetical protein L0H15_07985, partial [Nitrosospira sp.]|nr:hypothetical protein [Nitrosospira sp.]